MNKKIVIIFKIIFLMLMTKVSYAVEANIELKDLLRPMNSLSATFEQKVVNGRDQVLQKTGGQVLLKKPQQFRWEVIGNEPRLIVSNGKNIWDYDQDLAQVSVRKLSKNQESVPVFFLTGDVEQLEQDFIITKISKNKKCMQKSEVCFELKPHSEETSFQWIRIGFKSKVLKEMELLDQLGQQSTLIFSDVVLNKSIPGTSFTFTPPKGIDVIK